MKSTKKAMWEILVPTKKNDGTPIRTRFHRVWDTKVRTISGGLTIMPVAKGQWLFKERLYEERMIPVRIIATREEIEAIIDYTMKYYDQEAVLAYKVAEDVILRHRDGTTGDIG